MLLVGVIFNIFYLRCRITVVCYAMHSMQYSEMSVFTCTSAGRACILVQDELCNMILDCCAQQRTFEKFYGLLAQV